jgi:TrmH family RNA methyltransferase
MAALPEAPESVVAPARALAAAEPGRSVVREVDALRHALLAATGQSPADWDLLDPATGRPDPRVRRVLPGVRAYLEDLRSPFNVGTIFRTADAFGVEELLLSPACADPNHPRARRSAMGAVELLPWMRRGLEGLAGEEGLFGLELGGEPIDLFPFPARGIAVIGSEELGLSPEARALCGLGVVSIPMSGAKGSLNVSVAFGILMHAWTRLLLV